MPQYFFPDEIYSFIKFVQTYFSSNLLCNNESCNNENILQMQLANENDIHNSE